MRMFIFLKIAILLILINVTIAQETQIDFSGEWILDADKSELGERGGGRRGGMAPTKLIVQQEENKLVVESFRKNREGEEVSVTANYTLDGEECENEIFNRTSISTAEWSEDGSSLLILTEMTFTRGDQEFTMEAETSWMIEDSLLILESSRSTPRGDMTMKAVYYKADK